MNEKQKSIMKKIGMIAYAQIKKGLDMAEATPEKNVYHVTKNKDTLREKEYIKKVYPNILILTEEEWLRYAFEHLSPEEQKKVAKKIKNKLGAK